MTRSDLPRDLDTFDVRLKWAIEHAEGVGTQAELARKMEVSTAYIAELAGRESPPGKKALRRLSEALGVPEVWLHYGGVIDGEAATTSAPPTLQGCSELEEVWIEEIRRIAALDEPESRKMLYRDSLASLMSRAWGIAAERAAEARARAVERGDAAANRRASAVSSAAPERLARAGRRARGKAGDLPSDGEAGGKSPKREGDPPGRE